MTCEDLYDLARRNGACPQGLAWLRRCMKKNPGATAHDFFEAASKLKYTDIDEKIKMDQYLSWCFIKLLEWPEGYYFTYKAGSLRRRLDLPEAFSLQPSKLASALARAFED